MEKITEKPASVSREKTPSTSASLHEVNPALQKAEKRFSSLLHKPAREKPAAAGKTRQYLDEGLGSVQKRLDTALSGVSRRSDNKEHPGGSPRDPASDADQAGLSNSALRMEHIARPDSPASIDASPTIPDTPAAPREIGKIAEQIAERILVTSPDSNTHPEVRIQLKSSVLDGSEVRVFREGGELKVVFIANGKDAENFLGQNQGQLQQAIGDRLKDERVQISVELRESGAAESEHNEGRSRQQYIAPDHDLSNDSPDQ